MSKNSSNAKNKHLISIADLSHYDLQKILRLSAALKAKPEQYAQHLKGKSLLMIFEKPSLRTHLSFDVAMFQLGGHAIYYNATTSPFGSGKESIKDTVQVAGRYVNIIMARLFEHSNIQDMAKYSPVPIINALTNYSHPCQAIADFFTVQEKLGTLNGKTIAYLGDANNNVTHSLLFAAARLGVAMRIGSPKAAEFSVHPSVIRAAKRLSSKVSITLCNDAIEAVRRADVVYTDSWMSYHIPKSKEAARIKALNSFQINRKVMAKANPRAFFMHCLPAGRGIEVTDQVLDGKQSVVLDQAENRLHTEKAILLHLLNKS